MPCRNRRIGRVALAAALGLLLAAVWVGLTAWSGKTYHLAPLLSAAAPGWTVRATATDPDPRLRILTCTAGLAAAGLGWAAIEALGIEPTATIVHQQPGGVFAEVVTSALLGAVLGQVSLLRTVQRVWLRCRPRSRHQRDQHR